MSRPSGWDVVIYTDGACQGNPGPGGWASVLERRGRFQEAGGREERTTNNRMEMRAAIEGLRRILIIEVRELAQARAILERARLRLLSQEEMLRL